MKGIGSWGKWVVVGLALLLMVGAASAQPRPTASGGSSGAPLGTGFTFQGRLSDAVGPVDTVCTLTFELYDSPGSGSPPTGGTLLGTDTQTGVPVNEGNFAVLLNEHGEFGANAFAGEARYLQITVDCGNGPSTLSPRQALTATPYALYALQSSPVHSHWGQTWTGSGVGTGLALSGGEVGLAGTGNEVGVSGRGATGVEGVSKAAEGRGVFGRADYSSGTTYGVYGQSGSPGGTGVHGEALGTRGDTIGVAGRSESTAGMGVFGWARASSGATYGVYGRTDSPTGSGVAGVSRAGSGETAGVFGQSASGDGRGVYGRATASDGEAYGVYGESESPGGAGLYGTGRWGVKGYCTSQAAGVGVYGNSSSQVLGIGVHGDSSSPTLGIGVYGTAQGADGVGIAGSNASGTGVLGTGDVGVKGESAAHDGRGVIGTATATTGETYGVYGESSSEFGRGVYGRATASEGVTFGVYGESDTSSGTGVCGAGRFGVFGWTRATDGEGVVGIAYSDTGDTVGVRGRTESPTGKGVYGQAWGGGTTGASYGVYGESWSSNGAGVYGTGYRAVVGSAMATSGNTYAVIGYTASPDGSSGFFRNTSSGLALRAQTDEGSGNIIEAWSGFGDQEFRVERDGDVRADGSFQSPAADYAEVLPGAAGLEAGDVLVIGEDGELARSTQPYQLNVAGVLSTDPAFVAGAREDDEHTESHVPLAVMGVVPVKVSAENGCIRPGDLLASSATPGHAMRAGQDARPGTIIGKALQGLDEGTGVIKMLVWRG